MSGFSNFCLQVFYEGKEVANQGRMPISLLMGNSYSESTKILQDFIIDNYDYIKTLVENNKFKELKVLLCLHNMECFSIKFLKELVGNVSHIDSEQLVVDIWYLNLK